MTVHGPQLLQREEPWNDSETVFVEVLGYRGVIHAALQQTTDGDIPEAEQYSGTFSIRKRESLLLLRRFSLVELSAVGDVVPQRDSPELVFDLAVVYRVVQTYQKAIPNTESRLLGEA